MRWFCRGLSLPGGVLVTVACASNDPAATPGAGSLATTGDAMNAATGAATNSGAQGVGGASVTNSATLDSSASTTGMSSGTQSATTTLGAAAASAGGLSGTGGATATSVATTGTTTTGVGTTSAATTGPTTEPPATYCKSFYNSSGGANPCYVGSDGLAHCIVNDGSTVTLSEVPGTAVSVTGWDYTTRACVVNDAGAVYCGDYGVLSEWVASGATQVSGLANGPCAIVDGSVQCDSVSAPASVDTGAGVVTLLGCYSDGCCAATDTPALYCWGDTSEAFGVDAAGAAVEIALPEVKQVLQIGAGQQHACVLLEGGQVHCWGQDWNGMLGGLGSNMSTGITVAATGAVGVASGQFHLCIAYADGSVSCAGAGGVHGAGQNSSTLAQVPGISSAIAVTAGRYASCALLADASIQCWGDYGPGDAGTNETTTPVDIIGVPAAPCQ